MLPRSLICLVASFLAACAGAPPREAPLVPRLDTATPAAAVSGRAVLDWAARPAPSAWVHAADDRLADGLALVMMPLVVDWSGFDSGGVDRRLRVRNVNVDGNPIDGRHLLATVDVPLDRVAEVEWCTVLTRRGAKRDTASGHGTLRFIFEEGAGAVVLDDSGAPRAGQPVLDDLVLSWEAWRAPRTRYQLLAGFDPDAYALTLRAYAGQYRFLLDAMRNSPWECFPLALPDVPHAGPELLLTGLTMGDGLARRMLRRMLDRGTLVLPGFDELQDFDADDAARARDLLSTSTAVADPVGELMGEAALSYDVLRRSCVTQGLLTVQLAIDRLYAEHGLGPSPQLAIIPEDIPGWSQELATAGRGRLLYRAPQVLWFVARHSTVLPGNAWRTLDEAGLLRAGESGPVRYYYHIESMTPWGHIKDNMM